MGFAGEFVETEVEEFGGGGVAQEGLEPFFGVDGFFGLGRRFNFIAEGFDKEFQ